MQLTIQPTLWKPKTFGELIGPARDLGEIIGAKIQRYQHDRIASVKWMFDGAPGTGKSSLAALAASALAGGERLAIEERSGLVVNLDLVKRWMDELGLGSLFGTRQVKLVQEMDKMTTAAQDLLLQYLDLLDGSRSFIGTSNAGPEALQERFHTRLQYWKVSGPSQEQIEALLNRWEIDPFNARSIAMACCGNVRLALNDLESQLDVAYARSLKAAA